MPMPWRVARALLLFWGDVLVCFFGGGGGLEGRNPPPQGAVRGTQVKTSIQQQWQGLEAAKEGSFRNKLLRWRQDGMHARAAGGNNSSRHVHACVYLCPADVATQRH